jgi:hypothetical protein
MTWITNKGEGLRTKIFTDGQPHIELDQEVVDGKHEMLRNVLVVDDDHAVLDDLNSIGVHAVHPSMFLCMGS